MSNRKLTSAACFLLLSASLALLTGCSNDKEEKGVVEQASDKVAAKAVEHIQKPIDKAKNIQAIQDAQSRKMKGIIEESGAHAGD